MKRTPRRTVTVDFRPAVVILIGAVGWVATIGLGMLIGTAL